jgi:predicted RNA binding protein YcfA (HicA-like mRNA interferase family)
VKVREVIKQLKDDGWVEVRQESSHRTLKKDGVKPNIAVSGFDRDEVLSGQLSDIRRKSGLPLR